MFNTLFNTKLKKKKKEKKKKRKKEKKKKRKKEKKKKRKTKFFQATPFGLLCALFSVLEREKYH